MKLRPSALPATLSDAHVQLLVAQAERDEAQAEAANARADVSDRDALIMRLQLEIEKLKRDKYGARSERSARLIDQMELVLEEAEATATDSRNRQCALAMARRQRFQAQ